MKYKTGCWLAGFCMLAVSVWGQDQWVVQPARKRVELSGYTRSRTTATISAEVSGRILSVHYDDGDTIGEQPFFEIDPTFVDFQIESVQQALKKNDAALQVNESRTAYLEKEFRRIDGLLRKDGAATGVSRDAAEEDLNQARLARLTILAEKGELAVRLAELQERRRRHRIDAPRGWVVIRRMAEAGEVVAPNHPLAEVADFQTLVVPLALSSRELAALEALPGVFGITLEGRPATARVDHVNPRFIEETRKLNVELALADHPGPFRGGLQAVLELEVPAAGLWVPRAAVINRYDNPRVVVADSGATVGVLVLGETEDHLVIAKNDRLPPGTVLGKAP